MGPPQHPRSRVTAEEEQSRPRSCGCTGAGPTGATPRQGQEGRREEIPVKGRNPTKMLSVERASEQTHDFNHRKLANPDHTGPQLSLK